MSSDASEDESSEDESTASSEVGVREDARSEPSTAPPITPLDELLLAGDNTVVNPPVVVASEDLSKGQHESFAEYEPLSFPEPVPVSTSAPLEATIDPRKLNTSVHATGSQPSTVNVDVAATAEAQGTEPAPVQKPHSNEKVGGASNNNNSSYPLPHTIKQPVHNIRWFKPEEWRAAFRKLVSGKKKAGIEDLVNVNITMTSLEEMIEALPGETLVRSLVSLFSKQILTTNSDWNIGAECCGIFSTDEGSSAGIYSLW